MDKFPITKSGLKKLGSELGECKIVKRDEIKKAIEEAREFGDLSENAEYHEAKREQGLNEGKIADLEAKYERRDVIDISSLSGGEVKFGATVTLMDCNTEKEVVYTILGEYEADISKRRVSYLSPIARALIGASVGDFVSYEDPMERENSYQILSIKFVDIEI